MLFRSRAHQGSLDDAGPTRPYATRAPDLPAKAATVSKGSSFFGRAKRTVITPSEPLRATVAPLPPPPVAKLSRSKGSFFSAFGRSTKGSDAQGRKDKALPPMPMPAPIRNGGGPPRHDSRQLVSAGP